MKNKGKIVDWNSESKCKSCLDPAIFRNMCLSCVEGYIEGLEDDTVALEADLAQANKGRASLQESIAMTEALLLEVEGRLAEHEWVAVEDDKPKNDGQVWMAYGGYTYVGYYNKSYKVWYIFNYSGGFTKAEKSPDHWKSIHLPKPPMEKVADAKESQ